MVVREQHLRRVLLEYVKYFNHARPHQGIGQCLPVAEEDAVVLGGNADNVIPFPVLGGLHHDYRRVA